MTLDLISKIKANMSEDAASSCARSQIKSAHQLARLRLSDLDSPFNSPRQEARQFAPVLQKSYEGRSHTGDAVSHCGSFSVAQRSHRRNIKKSIFTQSNRKSLYAPNCCSVLSAKDLVQHTETGKNLFGIKGYAILTINPLDTPREIKWAGSYKPSYIDDHIRLKRHVPDKFYNTTANLSYSKTTKSNDTSKRASLLNSGMLKNPAPGTHQINESQTKPSNNCALNFKAPRSSFISEAEAVGRSSVPFYNKKYTLTEKRSTAPQVKMPSNTKYEPSFLKDLTATKLLSPHSYDATGSFFKTQVKSRLI